jgi:hypothetical protein
MRSVPRADPLHHNSRPGSIVQAWGLARGLGLGPGAARPRTRRDPSSVRWRKRRMETSLCRLRKCHSNGVPGTPLSASCRHLPPLATPCRRLPPLAAACRTRLAYALVFAGLTNQRPIMWPVEGKEHGTRDTEPGTRDRATPRIHLPNSSAVSDQPSAIVNSCCAAKRCFAEQYRQSLIVNRQSPLPTLTRSDHVCARKCVAFGHEPRAGAVPRCHAHAAVGAWACLRKRLPLPLPARRR